MRTAPDRSSPASVEAVTGARLARGAAGDLSSRARHGAPLAWGAATLALLSVLPIAAALHLDTARDLLIARDCVLGAHCAGAGPRSSFGGLMHGALWSHVLELREWFGLGIAAVELFVRGMIAVAAALVPVAARQLGRPAGAITWALWLPATLFAIGYPTLWNPTLWPVALGVLGVALLGGARTGGAIAFVVAGAALACAIDLHVSSALLVPFVVGVIAACSCWPVITGTAAAVVFVGVLAIDSPGAFAENRAILGGHVGVLVPVLVGAALAGWMLRSRVRARAPERRAAMVAVAWCGYVALVLPALAIVAGKTLHVRYLAPLVTPAAILGGAWLEALLVRRGAARARVAVVSLGVAAYVAGVVLDRTGNPRFRIGEVEALAPALYARGLAFGDLVRHVRGPLAYHLASTLAAFEPPDGRGVAEDGLDVLVVRVERTAVPSPTPPDWTVIDLGGSHVAVIVAYRPWVRVDTIEVCRGGAGARGCVRGEVEVERFAQHAGMRWADRGYASLPGAERPRAGETVSVRLPLRAPPGRPGRTIRLLRDECAWRIEQVNGAAPSQADAVRIASGSPDGEIVFTFAAGKRCRGWLPPLVELGEDEAALAALLESAGG